MPLQGADAFEALRQQLQFDCNEVIECPDHLPFQRLSEAVCDMSNRSQLDLAVLIRHALVHENARRGMHSSRANLLIPYEKGWPAENHLADVGADVKVTDKYHSVSFSCWKPTWLDSKTDSCLEATVAEEKCRRNGVDQATIHDPFLEKLGVISYKSPGQRTAIRSALNMPENSTLLISLPTGEGKSLVFQAVDTFGFGDGKPGVTPVIVPTVSLGLDHEQSNVDSKGELFPRAYVSQDEGRYNSLATNISEGSQGLCFLSPEVAGGRLRHSLVTAARNGHLRALVVDEAHLVEAWGTDFRTDFQLLSGLCAELNDAAKEFGGIRTILLSATLTQMSVDSLRSLFCPSDNRFGVVLASHIRPELETFIAPFAREGDRILQVKEALLRLPRPLILYTTTVEDAKEWFRRVKEMGFQNVGLMHGGSKSEEKNRLLSNWRKGLLDLAVGTSAFGLGIDYPHVRSVIHACIPESLDRYYQEVGRGGRDGRVSLSLLIPTRRDIEVAKHLNTKKVITLETGLARWKSMFDRGRTHMGGNRHRIRLDVSPGSDPQYIDMTGKLSRDWNARILSILLRAGLIRILAQHFEEGSPSVEIEILDETHSDEKTWRERVLPIRDAIKKNDEHNFKLMMDCLRREKCPSLYLQALYSVTVDSIKHNVLADCGGCHTCGHKEDDYVGTDRPELEYPWPVLSQLTPDLKKCFGSDGLFVLYYSKEYSLSWKGRPLRRFFKFLGRSGVRNLFILGAPPKDVERVFSNWIDIPFNVCQGERMIWNTLPSGPEIVFVNSIDQVGNLASPRPSGQERLLLLPDDYPDHSRMNVLFSESYNGVEDTLNNFIRKVVR